MAGRNDGVGGGEDGFSPAGWRQGSCAKTGFGTRMGLGECNANAIRRKRPQKAI